MKQNTSSCFINNHTTVNIADATSTVCKWVLQMLSFLFKIFSSLKCFIDCRLGDEMKSPWSQKKSSQPLSAMFFVVQRQFNATNLLIKQQFDNIKGHCDRKWPRQVGISKWRPAAWNASGAFDMLTADGRRSTGGAFPSDNFNLPTCDLLTWGLIYLSVHQSVNLCFDYGLLLSVVPKGVVAIFQWIKRQF